jgi:hypothetical protein
VRKEEVSRKLHNLHDSLDEERRDYARQRIAHLQLEIFHQQYGVRMAAKALGIYIQASEDQRDS